jgi:hypothetical protein
MLNVGFNLGCFGEFLHGLIECGKASEMSPGQRSGNGFLQQFPLVLGPRILVLNGGTLNVVSLFPVGVAALLGTIADCMTAFAFSTIAPIGKRIIPTAFANE